MTDDNTYSVWDQALTALVLIAVLTVTYACLLAAELVQRVLGATGANVVSRIMGLILAALAVQSMVGGWRHIMAT